RRPKLKTKPLYPNTLTLHFLCETRKVWTPRFHQVAPAAFHANGQSTHLPKFQGCRHPPTYAAIPGTQSRSGHFLCIFRLIPQNAFYYSLVSSLLNGTTISQNNRLSINYIIHNWQNGKSDQPKSIFFTFFFVFASF